MANLKKDAGEARQRPRPQERPEIEQLRGTPAAKPAGPAPTFDPETTQLIAGEPRGMISNPWVQHWSRGAGEVRDGETERERD